MYSFSYLEPVCCSMSSSNCCFLTCVYVSQEVGQVVWNSHLLKNFPQFIVIYTVKDFGIVSIAEIDVFLKSLAFSMIQQMLAICSLIYEIYIPLTLWSQATEITKTILLKQKCIWNLSQNWHNCWKNLNTRLRRWWTSMWFLLFTAWKV